MEIQSPSKSKTKSERKQNKRKMKLALVPLFTCLILYLDTCHVTATATPPSPLPWPEQFHALLFVNLSTSRLQMSNFWYDWPKRRNIYLIQRQLDQNLLYNVEWNNGTSFYFNLNHDNPYCHTVNYGIGIPRPDFLLDGSVYLGTQVSNGFLCNVWEKVGFIWYFEDVLTRRPVRWNFSDGISTYVMKFEVGIVYPETIVQAPAYCFNNDIVEAVI